MKGAFAVLLNTCRLCTFEQTVEGHSAGWDFFAFRKNSSLEKRGDVKRNPAWLAQTA